MRVDPFIDQGNDGQLFGARALGLSHCAIDGGDFEDAGYGDWRIDTVEEVTK